MVSRSFGIYIWGIKRGSKFMEKISIMKTGLLLAAILALFVSANAGWALDAKTFPGKGSKEAWKKAGAAFDAGLANSKSGNQEAAIMQYQIAIATYPYSDVYYRNLGVNFERRKKPGDLTKAEAVYRKATECDPKDWRNWNALATVLSDQKKYKECRDACKRALASNPPASELEPLQKTIVEIDQYLLTHR